VRGNALLSQFAQFGGGDIFSLAGTIALGFVHPFTLLLMGIVAIGFPATAIAGEREKGTLEVTLARPISRRGLVPALRRWSAIPGHALAPICSVATYCSSMVSATVRRGPYGAGVAVRLAPLRRLHVAGVRDLGDV
jgi:hypothetical protein